MSLIGLSDFLAEAKNDVDVSVATEDEIQGIIEEVSQLDPEDPQRIEFVGRVVKAAKNTKSGVVPTSNLTAKAEFEKRINQLPAVVRKMIARGSLKIVDAAFYSIKTIAGSNQVELLLNQDTKSYGLTNINGRKLGVNEWLLVTAIVLQSAVAPDPKAGDYNIPTDNILNGEFKLECGSRLIIPPVSCVVFDTTGKADTMRGCWKLDNPKWLAPETEIVPELKLPLAAAADLAIKLVFFGATLEKA